MRSILFYILHQYRQLLECTDILLFGFPLIWDFWREKLSVIRVTSTTDTPLWYMRRHCKYIETVRCARAQDHKSHLLAWTVTSMRRTHAHPKKKRLVRHMLAWFSMWSTWINYILLKWYSFFMQWNFKLHTDRDPSLGFNAVSRICFFPKLFNLYLRLYSSLWWFWAFSKTSFIYIHISKNKKILCKFFFRILEDVE